MVACVYTEPAAAKTTVVPDIVNATNLVVTGAAAVTVAVILIHLEDVRSKNSDVVADIVVVVNFKFILLHYQPITTLTSPLLNSNAS